MTIVAITSTKPLLRRVIDKNRVVLPSTLVKHWRLSVGDYVQFELSQLGDILYIKPVKLP